MPPVQIFSQNGDIGILLNLDTVSVPRKISHRIKIKWLQDYQKCVSHMIGYEPLFWKKETHDFLCSIRMTHIWQYGYGGGHSDQNGI